VSGIRGHVCCFFAVVDKSAATEGAADGVRGMLDSSAPLWRRRGHGVEMPAGVAAASDETGRECPDPQQVGRESLDGEEWEPPELLDGVGGDGDGEGNRAGEGKMPEPELASAPDGGRDAQPVPGPDWGLAGWAVRAAGSGGGPPLRRSGGGMRRTALSLGARGESHGRREQVKYGGLARRGERPEGGAGGAWI
jgi:hypothetical protein